MVFLQGAARPSGPAAACLRLAEDGHVELVISDAILDEIRDVFARPRIRNKFRSLTDATVSEFLDNLNKHASRLSGFPRVCSLPRDPKDEKYLDLAVAAQADVLVTRDKDLLSLMDPANSDGDSLRQAHPTLKIVDPVTFLHDRAQSP